MKMNDAIDMKGRLTLRLQNATGDVVQEIAADNDIMLSGRDLVAKLFANIPIVPISHIAVGTGTTVVNINQTALTAEIFRTPITTKTPGDVSDGANSRKKITVSADLGFAEANGALTEAAIFNNEDKLAVSNVMYNRVVFQPVNKTADFKLTLVWEILF